MSTLVNNKNITQHAGLWSCSVFPLPSTQHCSSQHFSSQYFALLFLRHACSSFFLFLVLLEGLESCSPASIMSWYLEPAWEQSQACFVYVILCSLSREPSEKKLLNKNRPDVYRVFFYTFNKMSNDYWRLSWHLLCFMMQRREDIRGIFSLNYKHMSLFLTKDS